LGAPLIGHLWNSAREFCWRNAWLVVLENDDDSLNLLGPLACFSIPIRDAILRYQESEEKRELFTRKNRESPLL